MVDFIGARDDGMALTSAGPYAYHQIICTLLQTDNYTSISDSIFTGWILFLMLSQQCQSTEGN